MTVEEAITYINGIGKKARKNSLGAISYLCDFMGNVQNELSIIHIAGTNGKGSVAAMLSHMLCENGYRVGRFTSPYIECFNDRIAINGAYISDDDLVSYTQKLAPAVEKLKREQNEPSWFAFLTAMAFWYFYDQKCDYVVLETGIGGLYDSTNIIEQPLLTVITSIGFDHTRELGNTLLEIAEQKCGIIKEGVPLITSPQHEDVMARMKQICAKKHSALYVAPEATQISLTKDENHFTLPGWDRAFVTQLVGKYQILNACTAVKACEVLKQKISLTDEAIYQGLYHAKWIGRFQTIAKNPRIVIDGAHNLSGMNAFCDSIDALYPDGKKIFVLGMVGDKDYVPCIKRVAQTADVVVTVPFDNPRSLPHQKIYEAVLPYCKHVIDAFTLTEGMEEARKLVTENEKDVICICGSLFLVADVLAKKRKKENGSF